MKIPPPVSKYFWGDDLADLSLEKHGKYIAQTIMDHGDTAAIRWLFTQFSRSQLGELLPGLKMSKKSTGFWSIYLS